MAIRKKSFTATIRSGGEPIPAGPASDSAATPATVAARPVLNTEAITLSKRTVSRILLAKSLLGR